MLFKKLLIVVCILSAHIISSYSQNRVVISDENNQEAHESAVLELISDDKGFLLPRMETDQRNLISDPAESLMIFNTETKCVETYISGEWLDFWCKPSALTGCEGVETGVTYNGYTYEVVEIGDQCWFAENLRTTEYNDGEPIALVEDSGDWHQMCSVTGDCDPFYCWYENDIDNRDDFGALYNQHVVFTEKLCPEGWIVPSDDDWKELEIFLGMSEIEADNIQWRGTNEGSKLAGDTSDNLWEDDVLIQNPEFDSSGFVGLPGGSRGSDGSFDDNVGDMGLWWSSDNGHFRRIDFDETRIWRLENVTRDAGMSVRCMREL